MKLDINYSELAIIRTSLDEQWSVYVNLKCPDKIKQDIDKYHNWCRIVEKDKMSDLYYIQSIRKKLNVLEADFSKRLKRGRK